MNKMLNIERRKEEKQSETSKAKYFLVLLLLLFFVIIINFGRWERPVEVKGAKGVTISYDANGGMGAPKEETKEEGKELKISTTKPVKVGYKFLGWTKVRNAQEIDFKPGSIYKEDVSRTLYASWNANSYKLTFEANGGSTVLPKMVTYDKEYGTLTESKKDGYIFEGWYFDNETFNNVVEKTDIVKITSDTTVYAKWEDVEALASLDDPSETPALPSTSTPTTPEATPTQKPTATPTQKPTATPTQEPTAPPTETPVTKVEVSFESNAGINIEAKTVEYGKAYGELPELTYVGYTFEGWYLDNETFTQKVNEISIVETNRDHTLYGGWKYKLAEIEIQATPTEWTNQNVEVTITPKEEIVNGAKIEYRIGNSEWKEYAGKFEVEKNCAIIARTVVGETKGQEASKEITNIDKVAPETAAVEAKEITTEEIELAIKGQDTLSGIKEIRVYVDSTLTKVYVYEENNIELKEEEYKIEGLKQNTEYEIHIEVEDMAGNVRSTQEETIKVTTEKLPAVEISHTPEAWTNQYVDVTIAFANDMSENITIEWQMEGDTEWFPYEGPFAIGENTTVYARTTDGTGKGETGAHAIENIDKANPTANVIADNDEVTTNSAGIEITGVDNESGIASIAIYVDGEVEYIKSDYTGNAVGSPVRDEQILTYKIEDLTAGTEYEIYTVVTDKAGNIISTENTPTTITTKDLPEVSITHAPTTWTNENVDVIITFANELASNGTTIEYKIGDGNWQIYTAAFEVDANNTIYARSAYGDEKGETIAHAIENIDTTNPTANVIADNDEVTTNSAEIEITGVDLESGIASIAIYVDGEVEYTKSDYTGNNVGSPARDEQILTYTIEDLTARTEYEIYTVVTDKAGNVVSTEDTPTTITTADLPAVTIAHTPTIWTNENVDVTIAFANGITSDATIEYKVGDGNWQTYTSAFEVTTNSTVYARSAYGDEKGETIAHAIENIDKTNPTANVIADNDEVTTNSAEIEITGVDLESGIASIAIYVDGELEYTKSDYTGNNVGSPARDEQILTYKIEDLTAGTEYEIYTVVTDVAGNIVSTEDTPTTITTADLPAVTIAHTPTIWTNENVDVTIAFANGITSDATIEYKIGDGNWQTYTSAFEVTTNSTVYARSAYGDEKGETIAHAIENIDKTNPTANVIADNDEVTTNSAEIEITGVDLESGIASIAIYVDGELEYTKSDYTGNNVGSPARDEQILTYTIEDLTAGTEYEIYTVVTDVAGNTVSTENTPTTITTMDLPAVTIAHTPTIWTNENVDVTIAFANGITSDATIEYKIGDGNWQTYTSAFEVTTNSTVYARAACGEEKGETATYIINNIDKTNPTANIIVEEDETTTSSAEIEITGVDLESGIASIAIYVDGELEYTKSDYTGNAVGSPARDEQILTYKIEDLIAGTEYEIYTVLTDKAGNTVSTENTPTTINTKDLPEVSITHTPTTWTNENVDVTIAFANNNENGNESTSNIVGVGVPDDPSQTNANNVSNGTTIEYKIGEGNWQTYTSAFEVITNSTVYARSAYGDEKGETATHAIENIDTTNPTANIIADNDETTTNSAEIEITGVDNESGIASIAIYVDGEVEYIKSDYTGNAVGNPARDEQILTYKIEDLIAGTEYEIYTVVTDKAGNTVSTENTPTTINTKDLPEVSITHTPTTWTNENVDVTIEFANELASTGTTIEYKIGEGNWQIYTSAFEVTTNSTVYARSAYGDEKGETGAHAIENIDTTNPTANIIADNDEVTTNSAQIEITGVDNESGIASIAIYVDGEVEYTKSDYTGNAVGSPARDEKNLTYTIEDLTAGQTHEVYTVVTDTAGNRASTENTPTTIITKDLSGVTIAHTPTGWTNQNVDVTIEFANVNNTSTDTTIEYKIGDDNWQTYTAEFEVNTNGTIYGRASRGDEKGVIASHSIENIDTTNPTANIVVNGDSITTNSAEIEITGVDNESGIASIAVYVDGKKAYEKSDYTGNNVGSPAKDEQKLTYTIEALTSGTEHSIYTVVTDKAGNWVSTENSRATITTKEIEGIEITHTPVAWTNGNVDVTIEFANEPTSPGTTIEYRIGAGQWETYTTTFTVETNTIVYARGTDGTNVAEIEEHEIENIDKLAPTVNDITVNEDSITTSSAEIEITAADSESGISEIQIYVDGELEYTKADYTGNTVGSPKEDTQELTYTVDNLAAGVEHSIYAIIKDKAGNIVNTQTTPTVVKTQDLQEIIIAHTPTRWTNGNVDVTIEFANETPTSNESTIQWQMTDDNEWYEYEGTFAVGQNTSIYTRVTDGKNVTEAAEYKIQNIDKVSPAVNEIAVDEDSITTSSAEIEITVVDLESGIASIAIYVDGILTYTKADYTGNTVGSPVNDTQKLAYIIEALTAGQEHEIYTVVTDKAGNVISTENSSITITTNEMEGIEITHTPMSWTNGNVDVAIEFENGNEIESDDGITIQWQMTGDTEWFEYEDIFAIGENTIIYARTTDGTNVSETIEHPITNIDKVNPKTATVEIDEESITTSSAEIEINGGDEESGLKEIRLYVNEELYETYEYNEYPVALQTENITIENLPANEIAKIKIEVEDRVGNVSSSEEGDIVVIKTDIARVVELDTVYYSIKDALEACEENKELFEKFTIEILENTEETIVVDQGIDVTIDLQGKTITGKEANTPTLTITEGNKVVLLDTVEGGAVISTDGTAVRVDENAIFVMGIDEKPINLTAPKVQGKTKGIEAGGTFNFYDGIIYGEQTVDGLINEMPLLYSGVTIDNGDSLKTTLGIISDVEARIGRKTYMKLEDAVADAGTLIGEDGSQVEIVLVKDVTKTEKVVIDETKNILLNLDGYRLTTDVADYVIENNGKLEVTSTPDYQKGTKLVPVSNETYYFVEADGVYKSNNTGVNNGVANSYVEIDLTNYSSAEQFDITVNAEIDSQANNDLGYATVNTSTTVPTYNTTAGRFIYISGTVEATDYTTTLTGGQKYYLHLGYRKNGNTNTGTDTFTVNSIEVTDSRGISIEEEIRGKSAGKITSTTYDTILNNGQMKVSDGIIEIAKVGTSSVLKNAIVNEGQLEIAGGVLQSGVSYTNMIQNGKTNELNGDAVVKLTGGTIGSTVNRIYGIYNYANGVVESAGGKVSTYDIAIYSFGTLKLDGGTIKSSNSRAINIGNTVTREIIIKNATIKGIFGVYNDSRPTGLEVLVDNCNISGFGTGVTYGVYNNSSSGTINVSNSTISEIKYAVYNSYTGVINVNNSTMSGTNYYLVYNSGSGVITVLNSEIINGGNGVYNASSGTIDIENCFIESTGSTVIVNGSSGTINIKSGEIVGYSNNYTINNAARGTINIGTKDGEINEEEVIIRLGTGISNISTGKVNFYDGKIVTLKANEGLMGSINDIEEGVDIVKTTGDTYNTYTLGTNIEVAQVGETKYNSVQEAVEACGTSEEQKTVTILKDIITAREIVIDEGQNIKLDINGHSILVLNEGITNNGKLELVNGLGTTHKIYARTQMPIITNNGELVIGNVEISRQTAAGSSSSYINVVYNTGKLVLNGGTISATTDYTRGISNVGEIIVNSGTITGTGSNGGMGIITSGEGKTIINGGTIAGGRRGIYAKDSSEIVITGGNINSKSDYAIYIDNSTSNNVNIRVEGGTITGGSYGIYSVNNNGEIVIKEENENVPTIIKGNSGICLQGESVAEIDEGEVIAGSYEGIVLDGTSKLVLKGGIVKSGTSANGYEAISLSGTSSLEMSGGEALSEKGYGIEINSTTVTAKITGGRVASGKSGTTTYSGIKNNGILVLGEKIAEGNVENPSIVSPEIIGTKYGVENIGTFKFYDGIIEGQLNGSIYGSVAEWEEGYEVIKTNNEELARETAIVSRMSAVKIVETGVEYGSISEAITASSTNKCTIQLLRSNILIDTVIVSEGQEIVLDLAGYSLTSQNEIMLQNDGTLKITNSTNASSTIENQLGEVVQNNGNLILENVTISHITETNRGTVLNAGVMKINSGTIKNTVGGNNVSVVYNTGKLELNEGTISYNYNTTGTTTSRGVYNTGELIVNGGSITVNKDYGIYTVGTSKVTINGGTLLGPTGIYAESSSEIRVTGGSITGGTAGTAYGIHIANNSNVNLVIEGGKIEGQDGIYVPNNTGEIIIKEVNENIQTLIEGSTGIYLSGESTIKIEGGTVFGEYNGIDAAKSSKIELTGGNIKNTKVNGTHYSAISLKDSSQLEMSGGEVIGETGLAINVGTINAKAIITGGKVSSGQNGTIKNTAINNIGTLVLGEKIAEDASETPSIINPEIIGTKYGVSNAGTFKFYDGIITGTNGYEAIYGGVSELEEEYDIIKTKNTEEQIETAVLSNASAVKIVETEETYSSILEAVEACNTNEYTIQLLRNIVTPLDLVTIGEGQNITLDLAGYTITARNNAIFKNEGTFVIIDSSDSKSGKIENFVGSVLDNSGISRIESGTIKTISTNNIAKIAISNSGKLIVNGGTISGEKNAEGIDSESDNIGIYNTGELIVNGGKIFGKTTKSYSSCHGRGIHNAGGKLTVNGGEISAEGMGNSETAAIYVEGEGNEIKFTNGIVKDTNSAISIISGAKGTVEISGGELAGNYGVYANNVPDFDIVITGGKVTATDNGIYLIGASKARIEGGKLESTSSSNYAIQITGTSVLEINGGEVVSRYHGIHISSNATLMMTGGEVCSEQIGIRMDSKTATATITGGTVSSVATGSSKYSAIYNEGTLTLGDNATRVSTINPEITGTSYGVENTGTFKFYDGIIRGPSGAIYGAVSEVADDHKVQNLDDGKTATLEVDAEFAQVAELNGVYYNTLDVAIASASGGAEQTIKICTDVNLNEGITIPAGKNIKIDLNGYVIRGIFEGALITNNGTLTVVDIIDTSALLEGEVINAIVQNTAGIGIQNNGTLNIGVLTRTVEETKLTIAGSTAGIVNSGSLTLNGGQVKGATAISGNAATPRSGYTITTTTLENLETTKLTSSIGVQTDPSDVVGADDSALPEQGDESTSTDPVTQYLISYDANGGTNTPQAQYKIAGQGIVLVGQPTRDGFAFAGWSTEQAGTIAEYMPGNTYEEDAILILYAIWE